MAHCALRATSRSSIRWGKPLVWRGALLSPSAAAAIRQTSPFATALTKPRALPIRLWRATFLRRSQSYNRGGGYETDQEAAGPGSLPGPLLTFLLRRVIPHSGDLETCRREPAAEENSASDGPIQLD